MPLIFDINLYFSNSFKLTITLLQQSPADWIIFLECSQLIAISVPGVSYTRIFNESTVNAESEVDLSDSLLALSLIGEPTLCAHNHSRCSVRDALPNVFTCTYILLECCQRQFSNNHTNQKNTFSCFNSISYLFILQI